MTTFGYRVMELYVTPLRKPDDRVPFTEPQATTGLRSAVLKVIEDASSAGQKDDGKSIYTRISVVKESGWGILLTAQGGDYGERREIFDVESGNPDDPPREIKLSDAVLKDFHILFIIPPYGVSGLMISEVRGRSHLTAPICAMLNSRLRQYGICIRLTSDLVDAQAWSEFLSDEGVGITGVELVQSTRSADRTAFTQENVKSARLQLSLVDGSEVKRRILSAVRAMRDSNKPPKLAGIVGLRGFKDEDFDEQQVITVHDGRQRKIDVTSSWPRFTYPIDTDEPISAREFVEAVISTAKIALDNLNVDLSAQWRPKILD
ncbi:hypothetical protein [Nocardia sp. NPDC047654]|uniref:hypothetical protein n=1 Tax=Nocardia sp. NPDC047654 TaxID=3364314 RepID=UPI0037247F99